CPHCETGCNDCLLDSQSRHDFERINRKLAKDWLGDEFSYHIGMRDEAKLGFTDGHYAPGSIENVLRRLINGGAEELILVLSADTHEWDMVAPQFVKALQHYVVHDGLKLRLVVPATIANIEDTQILKDLQRFEFLGVSICTAVKTLNPSIVAQAITGYQITTLASRSIRVTLPGEHWHQSDEIVVVSKSEPILQTNLIEISPAVKSDNFFIKDLSISSELNGRYASFGIKFWAYIAEQDERIARSLSQSKIQKISYSDRYLQNPVAIALLGSIFFALKPTIDQSAEVGIHTLFKTVQVTGKKIHDDWCDQDDYEKYAKTWLSGMTGRPIKLLMAGSNRDIPHRRQLSITFNDGHELRLRLDQGFGYWRLKFYNFNDNFFDFNATANEQLTLMVERVERAEVNNFDQKWSTDILIELSK
ncbi:MAG: hypothetical protein Q8J78_12880, partial [Moraxellaceae bacterium]|nr:hypothetical protein [Moraxellaceae bacterium]